jgi:outer membrane protein OmpA-like peptidoglycan-associated protein
MFRVALALLGLLVLVLPAAAAAQDPTPAVDVQRFHPVAASHGFVGVETANQLPALRPGFDLWLTYAHRPLQLSSPGGTRQLGILDGLFSGHLRAGFAFTDWAQIDVRFPFLQITKVGDLGLGTFAGQDDAFSLGDLWLEGRFRLIPEEKLFGLAVLPFITFPTGDPELHQTSGVPTFGAKVVVSKRWRYVHLGGHLGYRLKPGHAQLRNLASDDEILFGIGVGASPLPDLLDINVELVGAGIVGPGRDALGDQPLLASVHSPLELWFDARLRLPFGLDVVLGGGPGLTQGAGTPQGRIFLGAGWSPPLGSSDPDHDRIRGEADACPDEAEDLDDWQDEDGCPDLDNDGDGLSDEGDRCPNDAEDADGFEDRDGCPDPDNDGDGVPDAQDACPMEPEDIDGWKDADGCPDPDDDGDGIPDVADSCPNAAEDVDGFRDADGCPEPDNDDDGILDVDDLCPNEPEEFNGERDEDGCPDSVKAVVSGGAIVILDKVLFVSGKDRILKQSFPVLDAVRSTLADNPKIARVRIEGHTDDRGDDASNLRLSEKRAQAVLRWLVEHGIEPERLEATGYGEIRPIADNATDEGRQKNRRVEFKILD